MLNFLIACICIEQGQGHIHHGRLTVVEGDSQVQGPQEMLKKGQDLQNGRDHLQEEGNYIYRMYSYRQA